MIRNSRKVKFYKEGKNHQLAHNDIFLFKTVQDIKFYRALASSKDMTEFMSRILQITNRLGFSDYTFARLAAVEEIERPLSTLSKDLIINYKKEAFYEYDMVLDYIATGNMTPIFHSSIRDTIDNAAFITQSFLCNQKILDLNRRFGYEDSYLIPMKAKNGSGSVLFSVTSKGMFSSDFKKRIHKCIFSLQRLAEAVDYVGTTKFPAFFLGSNDSQEIVITPQPLRLLNILAKEDLNLKEAAKKLGVTLDTANKHIAAAKQALGAHTQAGAVYRAIQEGLITEE